MKQLLIAGSLAYDYILSYPGMLGASLGQLSTRDGCNITLQARSMGRYFGGCGGNVTYTLALLGERPRLLSIAGDDADEYQQHLTSLGVDFSAVRRVDHLHTATCVIITDDSQNRVVGFFGGATDLASQLDLSAAVDESIFGCIIVPDDGPAMLKFAEQCRQLDLPFIFDFGSQVSGLSGSELTAGARGAQAVVCNEYELSVFHAKTGWDLSRLLAEVPLTAVTRGAHGCTLYMRGGSPVAVPACPLRVEAADSTGAGDAFRAGFGLGWSRNLPWEVCARLGSTASAFVLEAVGTQGHGFSKSQFIERYQANFGDYPLA
ncbi:MAG: carbohydrate kinase family protein [Vulcanimicrobiota bacterium]